VTKDSTEALIGPRPFAKPSMSCFPVPSLQSIMPAQPRFELFNDTAGEWRWRLVATNGEIIADSGEGYTSKQGAKRGIESVKRVAEDATVVERSDE
jgi:uncharacterized protein YegP (UPF0339 family)